jgi:hypothetical protein
MYLYDARVEIIKRVAMFLVLAIALSAPPAMGDECGVALFFKGVDILGGGIYESDSVTGRITGSSMSTNSDTVIMGTEYAFAVKLSFSPGSDATTDKNLWRLLR